MTQSIQPSSKFNDILEMADDLPFADQQNLIEILQKRLSENRRKEIAAHIAEAHQEYQMGKAQKVTVHELMADLDE